MAANGKGKILTEIVFRRGISIRFGGHLKIQRSGDLLVDLFIFEEKVSFN